MVKVVRSAAILIVLFIPLQALSNSLTFEERVAAQEAIQRVYFSHQEGSRRTFEQALPKAAIKTQVLDYLKQSYALEHYWKMPITGETLRRELERIIDETRFPDRIQEIFKALDHNPVLIYEAFVRSSIAQHLAGNFYDYDETIHDQTKAIAESLRTAILTTRQGDDRSTFEISLDSKQYAFTGTKTTLTPDLDLERFETLELEIALWEQGVSPIEESVHGWSVRKLIQQTDSKIDLMQWYVQKEGFDRWFDRQFTIDQPSTRLGSISTIDTPTELPEFTDSNSSLTGVDDSWDERDINKRGPERNESRMVWTGSKVLIWGGGIHSPNSGLVTPGFIYDPMLDRFEPMSATNDATVKGTAIWTGTEMIICCGDSTNPGNRYDPSTDTWTVISSTNAPGLRNNHIAVWTGDKMLVWGDDSQPNQGYSYDPTTDTWTLWNTIGQPSARDDAHAGWTGSQLIIWGGKDSGGDLSDGALYDPVADTWSPMSSTNAPTGASTQGGGWLADRFMVYPTDDTAVNDTASLYNPLTDTWTTTTPSPANAAEPSTVHWTGSEALIYRERTTEHVMRYNPSTNNWRFGNTLNQHGHLRYFSAATWIGSELFTFGGNNGLKGDTSSYRSGARYSPQLDRWLPTRGGMDTMDDNQGVITWTGNHIVVIAPWFTHPSPGDLTGARYDTVLGSWKLLNREGAPFQNDAIYPQGRTVVWTGDQIITTQANASGRYDPLVDRWIPMSQSGGPTTDDKSAVWTGSEMLLWGGRGEGSGASVQEGLRYDPVSDSWSPLSSVNAPSARYDHIATWTGSKMLIWGGRTASGSTNVLDDGGSYDPTTDTWTPMSDVDAPSARANHAGAWTGEEWIIWGGSLSFSNALADGARYNPLSDSWASMSSVGAPTPRSDHAAVWTGGRVVIFNQDTGGRYIPSSDTWEPMAMSPQYISTPRAALMGEEIVFIDFPSLRAATSLNGVFYTVAADLDGDGVIDQEDCEPNNASVSAFPVDIEGLMWNADETTFTWTSTGDTYDVARGVIREWPTGSGASETCHAAGLVVASSSDASVPAIDSGFWYLVRGVNACGPGSYGNNSVFERNLDICP